MTPQENAFMKNLIMQNYRRRMKNFILNLFVFPAIVLICIFFEENMTANIVCIIGIIGLINFWIFFSTYISQNEVYNWFPWSVKKRQIEAMEQLIKGGADFKELSSSPALNEYFF